MDIGRHIGKTVIAEAEATGARCTKGGQQSFKYRHPPGDQEHEFQHRQEEVDAVQNFCRGLHLRHQLIHLGAGAFGFHQVDMGTAGQGQQGEQEHQNAQTVSNMASTGLGMLPVSTKGTAPTTLMSSQQSAVVAKPSRI